MKYVTEQKWEIIFTLGHDGAGRRASREKFCSWKHSSTATNYSH